jgi:hypothetical protein
VGRTPPTLGASLFITTDPCATSPNAKLNVAILFPWGASPSVTTAPETYISSPAVVIAASPCSAPHGVSLLLTALEQVHRRYQFVVVGYVVMPEHIHLLLNGE